MKATVKLRKPLILTQILAKNRCLEVSKILCKIDHLDVLSSGGLWHCAPPVRKISISQFPLFDSNFFVMDFNTIAGVAISGTTAHSEIKGGKFLKKLRCWVGGEV